jgi:biotin carboxylase
MATLLMVESWLHSTGLCLPPIIRDLGHDYILLTKDPALYPPAPDGEPHPVIGHAREVVVVDTNDDDAVCAAARTVADRRRIDGVLTTCDYYLATVATLARLLGLPGAQPDVMRRATQKHLVRAALDDAGLPNPAFAVAADWPEARAAAARIGTPLIAKPVDLNAGTAVERICDEAALKDAFWTVTGAERNTRGQPLRRLLLIEERLEGEEISVEALTFDGRTTIVGITDKSVTAPPACVESGHMFPARLDPRVAKEVEAFAAEALDAIGFTHGLSHIEVMITADGPRIVEINPRQGGGYIFDLVHLVTGTHPLEMLVDLALGRRPEFHGGGASRPASAATARNHPT